jgi:hypothetical protein
MAGQRSWQGVGIVKALDFILTRRRKLLGVFTQGMTSSDLYFILLPFFHVRCPAVLKRFEGSDLI